MKKEYENLYIELYEFGKNDVMYQSTEIEVPAGGFEPPIHGSGDNFD